MSNSLRIGIDSWIIQDGNYPDFQIGDTPRFATEFHFLSYSKSSNHSALLDHRIASRYHARGKIIYLDTESWFVDFGIITAYNDTGLPQGDDKWIGIEKLNSLFKVGDYLEGEIYLGIDPFDYFERLCKKPNIPEIMHDWRIEKIFLETTPWIIPPPSNPENYSRIRDVSQETYREVSKTNAWEDDKFIDAHYVLECSKLK